ncbi:hypothetical protein EV147_5106 [Cupriavidus agavae]|uniref:Uncharacterized protein n=1 Tax=Cupriavidus agavae TaxID=1001822 RepID=A0A4V2FE96_9BURK|nr:hypothetical protein EV147_5106 [Cupriavidus agavae]
MKHDSDEGRELEIRNVLINKWDPIGIKDVPEARDEYDSYIPAILELIERGADLDVLSSYLVWVEAERIGLPVRLAIAKEVANELLTHNRSH